MPLMAKLPAGMGEHDLSTISLPEDQKSQGISDPQEEEKEKEEEERDSGYEDFDALDEEPEDSDMEGSILHRPRPKKKSAKTLAPALPQRSDKRTSKILENVLLELQSLDGSVSAKEAERQSVSDPHELYLSSEEDASLSDDYEEYEYEDLELETQDGESKPSSRASSHPSEKDTARIVSFTLVTKPQIIQIVIPSSKQRHSPVAPRTTSVSTSYIAPTSTSYIPPTPTRKPAPLKLYPDSRRRMSISSTLSNSLIHHSNASMTSLPAQRKTSKLSNISNIVTNAKNSFLSSDPFASTHRDNEEDEETPKTPTSMAAAAWKKGLSRTMSKARKPSMPKLNMAYKDGGSQRDSLRLARELAAEETRALEQERAQIRRTQTMPALDALEEKEKSSGALRYQDIMKNVLKTPPPPPSPVRERKVSMGGMMGLGRKKSVKGKGDRYVG